MPVRFLTSSSRNSRKSFRRISSCSVISVLTGSLVMLVLEAATNVVAPIRKSRHLQQTVQPNNAYGALYLGLARSYFGLGRHPTACIERDGAQPRRALRLSAEKRIEEKASDPPSI